MFLTSNSQLLKVVVVLCRVYVIIARRRIGECADYMFQALYPCGNSAKFAGFTGKSVINFTKVGSQCYSQNMDTTSHANFVEARKKCLNVEADLAELTNSTSDEAVAWFRNNINTKVWIGGRREEQTRLLSWIRKNTEVSEFNPAWTTLNVDSTEGPLCLSYDGKAGYGGDCSQILSWVCENSENDYESGLEIVLQHVEEPGTNRTTSVNIGEEIRVSCMGKSKDRLTLKFNMSADRVYLITEARDCAQLEKQEDSVMFCSLKGPFYMFSGGRCFRHYTTELYLRVPADFAQAIFECYNQEKTQYTEVKNFTVLRVSIKPRAPGQAFATAEGKYFTMWNGDVSTYECTAKMANGTQMTFAVKYGNKLWARRYDMNGYHKDVGEKIWDYEKDHDFTISAAPGKSDRFSGNYIKLKLTFKSRPQFDKGYFICYSINILNSTENGIIKISKDDGHGIWSPVFIIVGPQKPNLVLKGITVKKIPDETLLYACDKITLFCIAPVGYDGWMEFTGSHVGQTATNVDSRQLANRTVAEWLLFQGVTEWDNKEEGSMVKLTFQLTVSEDLVGSVFTCTSTGLSTRTKTTEMRGLFRLTKGNLLPEMTITRKLTSDNMEYWEVTCDSYVGLGKKQTWDLRDFDGKKYSWIVVKSQPQVTSKSFPKWLHLYNANETWDDECGQRIISMVEVFLPSRIRGATLTCRSYESNEPFDSRYTRAQLSKSVTIKEGGVSVPPLQTGYTYYVLVATGVALCVVTILVAFCRWKRRTFGKKPAKLEKKLEEPANIDKAKDVPTISDSPQIVITEDLPQAPSSSDLPTVKPKNGSKTNLSKITALSSEKSHVTSSSIRSGVSGQ